MDSNLPVKYIPGSLALRPEEQGKRMVETGVAAVEANKTLKSIHRHATATISTTLEESKKLRSLSPSEHEAAAHEALEMVFLKQVGYVAESAGLQVLTWLNSPDAGED